MPNLISLNKMQYIEVLVYLSILPSSIYKDKHVAEVAGDIRENLARRYLVELILLNDREKADFYTVTELSSDDEDYSRQWNLEE